MKQILSILLFFVGSNLALAQDWDHKGEVTFQWRTFEDDGVERTEDTGNLVFTRVESVYTDADHRHVFRGFARVDQKDSDRDFMAFEDFFFSRFIGPEKNWMVLGGYKLFNWTATEAFHPADVINSRNFDSDIEYFEKLGEPTVELTGLFNWGSISFFVWPRFQRPQFPGRRSRLGFGVDIAKPQAVQQTSVGYDWAFQAGARLSLNLDDGDLSFHVIDHIDRNFPISGTTDYVLNPLTGSYVPRDVNAFQNNPTPYYFRKTQIGGTLQYALGSLLLKFEGAYRIFESDLQVLTAEGLRSPVDHGEVAFGLEYSLPFNIYGGDSYFFFEGGTILGTTKQERARLAVFQRDILLGFRHSFNDVMGSELFVTMIHDIERENERLYNFSYSRRLSDLWKINVGFRVYDAPKKSTIPQGLETLDGSNHGLVNLSRYF